MNIYTFVTDETAEFHEWLRLNVKHRYRLIQESPPFPLSQIRRSFRFPLSSRFHSLHECCEGGYGKCIYMKHMPRKRHHPEEDIRLRFRTRFRRRFVPLIVHIVFDDVADMVLCKLRWNDRMKQIK